MKSYGLIFAAVLVLSNPARAKEQNSPRGPAQMGPFIGQVQLCEGTEALGNEGQGVGASALINVYTDLNSRSTPSVKKCDLALAFAYEYGNDRGLKIGKLQSYNITALSIGKTECAVTEENGEVILNVRKAVSATSTPKKAPKVLVQNCKMTTEGF